MAARPSDFDEAAVKKSPTYKKWLALEDGQKLRYACRDFLKGRDEDEERLMRRIMIARRNNMRDKEKLNRARSVKAQFNDGLAKESKSRKASPMSSTLPQHYACPPLTKKTRQDSNTNNSTENEDKFQHMDEPMLEATKTFKAWLKLENGKEFFYSARKFYKGVEGEDLRLKRAIWARKKYRDSYRNFSHKITMNDFEGSGDLLEESADNENQSVPLLHTSIESNEMMTEGSNMTTFNYPALPLCKRPDTVNFTQSEKDWRARNSGSRVLPPAAAAVKNGIPPLRTSTSNVAAVHFASDNTWETRQQNGAEEKIPFGKCIKNGDSFIAGFIDLPGVINEGARPAIDVDRFHSIIGDRKDSGIELTEEDDESISAVAVTALPDYGNSDYQAVEKPGIDQASYSVVNAAKEVLLAAESILSNPKKSISKVKYAKGNSPSASRSTLAKITGPLQDNRDSSDTRDYIQDAVATLAAAESYFSGAPKFNVEKFKSHDK